MIMNEFSVGLMLDLCLLLSGAWLGYVVLDRINRAYNTGFVDGRCTRSEFPYQRRGLWKIYFAYMLNVICIGLTMYYSGILYGLGIN